MKRLMLLAIAAAALMGPAARADEAFDGFRNFCLAGRGASAPALTAADAAGWMTLPQQFLGQLPQTDFQDAQGRMRTSASGGSLLLTAHGTLPQAGPVRICAIGVIPAGVSDLAGQLEAFAGVAKQTADNLPEGLYAWRDDNGRHVSVDRNAPDFRAQVASGAVLIATTRSTPQMTMILLMSAAQ
jgi:hypothetical protein